MAIYRHQLTCTLRVQRFVTWISLPRLCSLVSGPPPVVMKHGEIHWTQGRKFFVVGALGLDVSLTKHIRNLIHYQSQWKANLNQHSRELDVCFRLCGKLAVGVEIQLF